VYYWRVAAEQIYMLYIFAKGEKSTLTPDQVKSLAKQTRELG
jgi:phage-related protein